MDHKCNIITKPLSRLTDTDSTIPMTVLIDHIIIREIVMNNKTVLLVVTIDTFVWFLLYYYFIDLDNYFRSKSIEIIVYIMCHYVKTKTTQINQHHESESFLIAGSA